MNDLSNASADDSASNGFSTGSIALLWTTFVVGLNSVASLLVSSIHVLFPIVHPEWEYEPDPMDFLWGVSLAIVAMRLHTFHIAYLKFLQRKETEKFKAEQAKLWNTIGCLCTVLLVYEFAIKVWISWEILTTPRFIPGSNS